MFDNNRDGWVNAQDAGFANLKVWRDADQDGVQDSGELRTLAETGIVAFDLASYRAAASGDIRDAGDATIHGVAEFVRTDGTHGVLADAELRYLVSGYRTEVSGSRTTLRYDDGSQVVIDDLAGGIQYTVFRGTSPILAGSFVETADGGWRETMATGGVGGSLVETLSLFSADGRMQRQSVTIDSAVSSVLERDATNANVLRLTGGDGSLLLTFIDGGTQPDALTGGSGSDIMVGLEGNDTLYGHAGDDLLDGGAGNDNLFGSLGADFLDGGGGLDYARFDDASHGALQADLAGANSNTGGAAGDTFVNIEGLILTGFGDSGYGTDGANYLFGLGGNDTLDGRGGDDFLDGGVGSDAMRGGAGNDRYTFDNVSDTASEELNEGIDTVISSVAHTLRPNFENLTIIDSATNAFGNSVANILTGNALNNILNGKEANDIMIGGAGIDTFMFDTALGAANVDRITDFNPVDDVFRLGSTIFTGIGAGTLSAAAFRAGTSAADASDRIIYNQATGHVFYDADGLGGVAQVLFAVLDTRPANVTNADFVVIRGGPPRLTPTRAASAAGARSRAVEASA